MTPELEKLQALMLHHAKNVLAEYREQWVPSSEHITLGLELFKPPMPGFQGQSVDEAIKRNDAYFRFKESWVVSTRHGFSNFIKHYEKWIAAPVRQPSVETHRDTSPAARETCPDHRDQQLVDGMCPVCYPPCPNPKCGERHSPNETCEEFASHHDWVKKLASGSEKPTGETTTISGDQVFDDKAKKEFKEIRMQQQREH